MKSMSEIKFVDTTLRDGQASLWAENMRTGMMLAVAERLDDAGFQAIEIIASSHIKKCVRGLRRRSLVRAHGRQRHAPTAHLRSGQRSGRLEKIRDAGQEGRPNNHFESNLFCVAQAHRRLLRAQGARGGG